MTSWEEKKDRKFIWKAELQWRNLFMETVPDQITSQPFPYHDGQLRTFIIRPVRPRAQFPWKTIRKKVPYEGRTRRSDRAGKTRTALLEMRTALLKTPMRVNDKNNFVAVKVCSLQNESWKWTFWERILLSRRIVPCRITSSVANSLQIYTPRKWRNLQLSQKPTTKQAVKETTFPDKLSDN